MQVAVDDFGTGYSSLSYLRKFPIDALKIDQSFVRQITTAGDDTTIVTAVISMGRSLKLRVIAEGVETLEELAFLRAHQCDEAQGYYFSRPVPAAAVREVAEKRHTGIPHRRLNGRPSWQLWPGSAEISANRPRVRKFDAGWMCATLDGAEALRRGLAEPALQSRCGPRDGLHCGPEGDCLRP